MLPSHCFTAYILGHARGKKVMSSRFLSTDLYIVRFVDYIDKCQGSTAWYAET